MSQSITLKVVVLDSGRSLCSVDGDGKAADPRLLGVLVSRLRQLTADATAEIERAIDATADSDVKLAFAVGVEDGKNEIQNSTSAVMMKRVE